MMKNSKIQAHHYQECGLPNIYVEGLRFEDDAEGKYVQIPAIGELHCLISRLLLEEERVLTGDEFYFLRAELGLSLPTLANELSVDIANLTQWQEQHKITANIDFAFRQFFKARYSEFNQKVHCWKQEISIPTSYSEQAKSSQIVVEYGDDNHYRRLVA